MKYLYLCLFGLLFFSNCKKDDEVLTAKTTFIRAMVGDIEVEAAAPRAYFEIVTPILFGDSNRYEIYIEDVNLEDKKSLSINFKTLGLIEQGKEYVQVETCPDFLNECLDFSYSELTENNTVEAEYLNGNSDTEFRIKFTKVELKEGGEIRGTFSGRLEDVYSQTFFDLKNGEFGLKLSER